ncbi:hypothetical protein DFH07DRAFT_1057422 [Mycena maculata]|uniref:F-box domain-containing protein n=1 Tax=Mycena maculata TaxID=230809 RepID=A0AAD7JV40_9AGAR|nr:hypothetical protein DFH07DRAFT_1057422 [Mycena maculata]
MRSLEIPSDIWRCVAGFLPTAFLLTLYSVNRTFLEICVETRYKAIDFVTYKRTKPLIKHVKDSNQAHSVRVLPWRVFAKQPKAYSWSSTRRLLTACVSPTNTFEEDNILSRLRKQTKRIVDAIKRLPALHEYHIDWDEGPFHPEFYSVILDVVPAIGIGLSTLSLKVPLHSMNSLPCLAAHLPNLDNLTIALHTQAHFAPYISERIEGLVVFLNTRLRTLRSLSISTTPTSMYLDLGPFFDHLGRGQRLTAFALCIPFDGGHLADPAPLRGCSCYILVVAMLSSLPYP